MAQLIDHAIKLGRALRRAVEAHGAPNNFTVGFLEHDAGGPSPTLAGKAWKAYPETICLEAGINEVRISYHRGEFSVKEEVVDMKVKVEGVQRPKTATDVATARLLREVARASDDGLDGDTRTAAWNLVEVASLRVGCAVEIHDHTEAELAQAARLVADRYDPCQEVTCAGSSTSATAPRARWRRLSR